MIDWHDTLPNKNYSQNSNAYSQKSCNEDQDNEAKRIEEAKRLERDEKELTAVLKGQVGAIQLGVSRALQNWEPDLRPALKACTISSLPFVCCWILDYSRVVERKKNHEKPKQGRASNGSSVDLFL